MTVVADTSFPLSVGPLQRPMIYSGHLENTFSLELSPMAWLKFPEILGSVGELMKV